MTLRFALATLAVVVVPFQATAQKYGTLRGRFVLKDAVPKRAFIILKGKRVDGGTVKNPKVCAAKDLKSDSLIIDPKTKGIGNVFVYLPEKPATVHPALAKTPKAKLKFDQVRCRFVPHTLFVRTDQTITILSDDAAPHNVHTYPLNNGGDSFVVPPKFRAGVPYKLMLPEPLPVKVGCDFHTWMSAYWLVLDHPYGAISAAETPKGKKVPAIGSFEIANLPYGEYEFTVWHEEAGYLKLGAKKGFKVKINKPVVELKAFAVPLSAFESKKK